VNKIAELVIPVLLSGLGVLVGSLYGDVASIKHRQADAIRYVVRIKHLEIQIADIEDRLRIVEKVCAK